MVPGASVEGLVVKLLVFALHPVIGAGSSEVFMVDLGTRSSGILNEGQGTRDQGAGGNRSGYGISSSGMLCLLCFTDSETGLEI